MSRSLSLILLVFASSAYAGDSMDASINSLPLFANAMGKDKYKGAAQKAQEAFFIQAGITQSVDKTRVAITKFATEKGSVAVETVTPFKAKEVFFVAGAAYALGVKKQIVQKFRDPLFPAVTHVVSVGKNSGSMVMTLPF